jgi:pSer/pThr/pTyr-binding forkhead associated (FHA) protein
MTVGRRDDNNICLSDGKISKYHAIIIRSSNGYAIKDRNSSNGLRVMAFNYRVYLNNNSGTCF